MTQQLKDRLPSVVPTAQRYITYEEFLGDAYEGVHAEWVDGKVVPMPSVSDAHQSLKVYALNLIFNFVDIQDLGEVRDEPIK